MTYQLAFSIGTIAKRQHLSERALATNAKVSRTCLRHIAANLITCSVQSIIKVAQALGLQISVIAHPREILPDYSTIAVSYKILRDGVDSWKIHIFDLVDEFRRTLDPRLLLLPPSHELDLRIKGLLAGVVGELCNENELPIPDWAKQHYYLESPWFLSGVESLKASAILESPLSFRRNNIFVHENFLERA